MVEKLHQYQGLLGRLHEWKDEARERWLVFKERRPADHDYSHVYRRKTRRELVRASAAVMGIEFSYAAETAFVSPTLLQIGVSHGAMTLAWALSPCVGFLLTPLLGSLSDRCRLPLGRRRPFILLLATGVFLGLLLVPNGERLGRALGDTDESHPWGVALTILGTVLLDFDADACQSPARAYLLDVTIPEDHARGLSTFTIMAGLGGFLGYALGGINWDATALGALLGGHVRAVFTLITFIFVLCVAYTVTSFREIPLDVLEREHVELQMPLQLHPKPGEQTKMVEDVEATYGSVPEGASSPQVHSVSKEPYKHLDGQDSSGNGYVNYGYDDSYQQHAETSFNKDEPVEVTGAAGIHATATLGQYLLSIVYMPHSLRILCLTNLFCWMAHVCYSLYFTDFVGEAVFMGDPQAAAPSPARELYEEGVRFGCWGMSMYSLSCSCYSLVIERLIKRFGAKKVYVGGPLAYSAGMLLMALTRQKAGVLLFSWTAGLMYSTLFTMPYLLVARYHASATFEVTAEGEAKTGGQLRGLGTDVAIVSSMVFLAQFLLSMCMGALISATGSTTAVVAVAAFLSFCGAVAATRVMYLDL